MKIDIKGKKTCEVGLKIFRRRKIRADQYNLRGNLIADEVSESRRVAPTFFDIADNRLANLRLGSQGIKEKRYAATMEYL